MERKRGEEKEKNVHCSFQTPNYWRNKGEIQRKMQEKSAPISPENGRALLIYILNIHVSVLSIEFAALAVQLRADDSSSMINLNSMHMQFECFQMKIDYFFSDGKSQISQPTPWSITSCMNFLTHVFSRRNLFEQCITIDFDLCLNTQDVTSVHCVMFAYNAES